MDEIIPEPLGGAHAEPVAAFPAIRNSILNVYNQYAGMSEQEIRIDR